MEVRNIDINVNLKQHEIKPTLEVIGLWLKFVILGAVIILMETIININAMFEILPTLHVEAISTVILCITAICLYVAKPIKINICMEKGTMA